MAFAPSYKEPNFINPPGASRRSRSSIDDGYLRTSSKHSRCVLTHTSQLAAALKMASKTFGRRPVAESRPPLLGDKGWRKQIVLRTTLKSSRSVATQLYAHILNQYLIL